MHISHYVGMYRVEAVFLKLKEEMMENLTTTNKDHKKLTSEKYLYAERSNYIISRVGYTNKQS